MSTTEPDPDDDAIQKLVDAYLDAVNTDDRAAVAELTCAHQTPSRLQLAANGERVRAGEITRTNDPNVARVTVHIGDWSGTLYLDKRNDTWCARD